MQSFGIDLGASTIKVVRLQEDKIVYKKIEKHFGKSLLFITWGIFRR